MSTSCIARSIATPTSLILGGNGPSLLELAVTTSPISPSSINFFVTRTAGLKRYTCPVASVTPASSAASIIFWASGNLRAIGFSTSTFFPASIASITTL